MRNALPLLTSLIAACAGLAFLAAALGWGTLADALAGAAALGGLGAFALVARITVARARELGRAARP